MRTLTRSPESSEVLLALVRPLCWRYKCNPPIHNSNWPIAQLVELEAVNFAVLGSSPSGPVREISSAVEQ